MRRAAHEDLICTCHPDSPFRWQLNPRPSMFQDDVYFRPPKSGQTLSEASTRTVEKARAEGKVAGYIKGISRNKEAELLRIREFNLFSRARANEK